MAGEADIKTLLKGIPVKQTPSYQQCFDLLKEKINNLIQTDFNRLVQLLYTVDVDENLLRDTLQNNKNTDAATLITTLLIEREMEKRKWKSAAQNNHNNIPDEDRW